MAITPIQHRAVDPYSSYNSDNVNKLTRILSHGRDVIAQGFGVVRDSTCNTRITLGGGVCTKDDVMINMLQDVSLDIHDAETYFDSVITEFQTTRIYLVLEYVYLKQIPYPVAKIGFLKDTSSFNTNVYLFLSWIDIENGIIIDILDMDPDNPIAVKRFPSVYFSHIKTRPPWSTEFIGQGFIVDNREIIVGGNESVRDWVYFDSDCTAMVDVVYIEGSRPTYWSITEKGKVYDEGDGAMYIGSGVDGEFLQLSAGIVSLNGMSANGQDVVLSSTNGGLVITTSSTDNKWVNLNPQAPNFINYVSNPAGNIIFAGTPESGNIKITYDNEVSKSISFQSINNIETINGIRRADTDEVGADVQILAIEGLNVDTDTVNKTVTIKTSGGGLLVAIPGAFYQTFNVPQIQGPENGLWYVIVDHSDTEHTGGVALDSTGYAIVSVYDAALSYEIIPYNIQKYSTTEVKIWFNSIPTGTIHVVGICADYRVDDSLDQKYSGYIHYDYWQPNTNGTWSYTLTHGLDSTSSISITRLFEVSTGMEAKGYDIQDIGNNQIKVTVSEPFLAGITSIRNSNYANRYYITTSDVIAATSTFGNYYVDVSHEQLRNIVGFLTQIQDVNNYQIFPSSVQNMNASKTRFWFEEIPENLPLTLMILSPVYLINETSLAWSTRIVVLANTFTDSTGIIDGTVKWFVNLNHGMNTLDPLGVFAYKNSTGRSLSFYATDLIISSGGPSPEPPVGYTDGNWIRVWFSSKPDDDVVFRIIK